MRLDRGVPDSLWVDLEDNGRAVQELQRAFAGEVRVGQHANGGKHGETAVVELTELVVVPALGGFPLRRAEEVARLVVRPPAVEDTEDLKEANEDKNLEEAQLRHLHAQLWRQLPAPLVRGPGSASADSN